MSFKSYNKEIKLSLSERNKKIIKKYKSGLSLQDLADIYGCSRQNIHVILKKNRIKTRKNTTSKKVLETRKQKKEQRRIPKKKLQELYIEQKMTISKIAESFSIPIADVSSLLLEYDIPKRSPREQAEIRLGKKYKKIDKQEFYSLYVEKNYTRQQMADYYGHSISSIDKHRAKFGIKKTKNTHLNPEDRNEKNNKLT